MTTTLTTDDFDALVAEVHGFDPVPWQRSFVRRVLAERRWPDVVDVPTGLGKTSLIDAAVFVAAASPAVGRRRLFFVVDRRLVVDEAFDHARRLAHALTTATSGTCARVASALRQPGDDGDVLQVTRMRGGLTWSWRWVDRPDRHAVIVGTVDQVGSRLLFRGYGVGEHLRPIDAALTGTDSLIVIDEAHLAEPFLATVRDAIRDEPQATHRRPIVVTMSATSRDRGGSTVHTWSAADAAHPVAGRRLRAARRLHLVSVATTRRTAAEALPRALAAWAMKLVGDATSGHLVAVVCNTVARARAVFDALAGADVDRLLLTGRLRPIDRDYLLHEWYPRLRVGRPHTPGRPLVLVATQTIEVGANIDLDALVTESAPLLALVQRLGRLNRVGERPDAAAIVIHDPSCGDNDPIYGPARTRTWEWLSGLTTVHRFRTRTTPDLAALGSGVDVSPLALHRLTERLSSQQADAMAPPVPYVPVLFPNVLDAWVRTSPAPHPDPPVAPFLHGIGHGAPDIAVVWRSDLHQVSEEEKTLLEVVPPAAEEAVEVPLAAVRAWLARQPGAGEFADVEGQVDAGQGAERHPPCGRVFRYRGRHDIAVISHEEIRPGDLIVVPAALGGCDSFGWNPRSTQPVADVADLASRGGHPLLRLGPAVVELAQRIDVEFARGVAELVAEARDDLREGLRPAAYRERLRALLRACPHADEEPPLIRNLRQLATSCTATPYGVGDSADPAHMTVLLTHGGPTGDDDAASSAARSRIELPSHQAAVARRAAEFAQNLGLPPPHVAAVKAAGRWHDEGKRDPRFQAMLYGEPLQMHLDGEWPPLAKSGMDPTDRAAFQRVRELSGYPVGMRHEALSARIARLRLDPDSELDVDLVAHLVAAHHGRSRPLLPPVLDPEPQRVAVPDLGVTLDTGETVDWDAPRRFATLNRRYGRWGLALLEAIVRLADIWCSQREEADATTGEGS